MLLPRLAVALLFLAACDDNPPLAEGAETGPALAQSTVATREATSGELTDVATLADFSVVDAISSKPEQPTSRDQRPPAFRVMSWNVEWFFDDSDRDNYSKLAAEQTAPSRKDWDWKRDGVAAAIGEVAPDVVGFQEIEGQKVLFYLKRAIERGHNLIYEDYVVEGTDYFTEQDVGMLVKSPVDVLSITRGNVTDAMAKTQTFGSVSKHQMTLLEVPVGDSVERVLVINLHLRAGADNNAIRAKQTATINEWIDRLYPAAGQPAIANQSPTHLIVMGDFNTEQIAGRVDPQSELGVMMSRGTPTKDDDLIDLHDHIPTAERGTHLLAGRQFDRILVSRGLVDDDPAVVDLSLGRVTVRSDVTINGDRDDQRSHWDNYWKMPAAERDLSDHYPVVADFMVR